MAGRLKGKIACRHRGGQDKVGRSRRHSSRKALPSTHPTSRATSSEGWRAPRKAKLDVLSNKAVEEPTPPRSAGRHIGQRRRLRAHGTVLDHQREELGFFLRPQREIHAPHDSSVPARHAGAR